MFEKPVTWNRIITSCQRADAPYCPIDLKRDPQSFFAFISPELPARRMRNWLHDELDARYIMDGYECLSGKLRCVRFRFIKPADCMRFALTFK